MHELFAGISIPSRGRCDAEKLMAPSSGGFVSLYFGGGAGSAPSGAGGLAGTAGAERRWHVGGDRLAGEVGDQRREFPVARALWRPVGAGGAGQPRLCRKPGGARRPAPGTGDGARRGHGQDDLGVQVQRVSKRRAGPPGGLGVAGRRSRDGEHLRLWRGGDGPRAQQGRQAALAAFAR